YFAAGGPVGNLASNPARNLAGGLPLQVPASFTSAMAGFNGAANVLGGAMKGFGSSAGNLTQAFSSFAGSSAALTKALEAIPSTIKMDGQVRHVHQHTGLEAFANAEPEFRKIAEAVVMERLPKMLRDKFSEAGPF